MPAFADFVTTHPGGALAVVALVSFAESFAIVGTLVPAAIVMFSAGALIGHGALDLWPTLLAATVAAVLGDGLSYELGRRHEARIRATSIFRRHRRAVARGEAFLRRHGAKSVLFARFMGAVRAFVPLLAGFARMPRGQFYAVNVASAALWAPAHILPGVAFGTSLAVAEAVSARLAIVVLLLAALAWGVAWSTSAALRIGVPLVRRLRDVAVRRARASTSIAARVTLALLDPRRPGSRALLWGALTVLGAGWLFLGVLEDVLSRDPLTQADLAVFNFLQALRSAPADRLMIALTELGSVGVMLPLSLAVLAWLAWRRCWRTAGYWVGTVAFGELLVRLLKLTLGRDRPLAGLYAGAEQYSFPSGHATFTTVVLAFLAFLLSRGQTRAVRRGVAVTAGLYIALVAFSRLYLGAHWFSDVLGGISLGTTWVAFVAMVYTQRRVHEAVAPRGLALATLATVFVAGVAWTQGQAARDLQRYAAPVQRRFMPEAAWLDGGWQQLPARRVEWAGEAEEALPLQWACSESDVAGRLRATGWSDAPAWSMQAGLGLLAPKAGMAKLPVLPRFDRGNAARLVFVRPSGRLGEREVLRLWRSEFRLGSTGSEGLPLWYGAVYREVRRGGGLLERYRLRQSVLPGDEALRTLPAEAPGVRSTLTAGGAKTLLMRCE